MHLPRLWDQMASALSGGGSGASADPLSAICPLCAQLVKMRPYQDLQRKASQLGSTCVLQHPRNPRRPINDVIACKPVATKSETILPRVWRTRSWGKCEIDCPSPLFHGPTIAMCSHACLDARWCTQSPTLRPKFCFHPCFHLVGKRGKSIRTWTGKLLMTTEKRSYLFPNRT